MRRLQRIRHAASGIFRSSLRKLLCRRRLQKSSVTVAVPRAWPLSLGLLGGGTLLIQKGRLASTPRLWSVSRPSDWSDRQISAPIELRCRATLDGVLRSMAGAGSGDIRRPSHNMDPRTTSLRWFVFTLNKVTCRNRRCQRPQGILILCSPEIHAVRPEVCSSVKLAYRHCRASTNSDLETEIALTQGILNSGCGPFGLWR